MKLCVALLFAATPLRGAPRPDSWIETLSWKPRAFLYHGFISDEEADHVVSVATPMIARSSVVAYDGKVNPTDEIRTSFGTFLRYCLVVSCRGRPCPPPPPPTAPPARARAGRSTTRWWRTSRAASPSGAGCR